MAKYTEKDAAKETDSSVKETREAWHEARKDAYKAHTNEPREDKCNDGHRR